MIAPDPHPQPRDPRSVRSQVGYTLAVLAIGALAGAAHLARISLHALGSHRYCDHRHRWHDYPSPPGGAS